VSAAANADAPAPPPNVATTAVNPGGKSDFLTRAHACVARGISVFPMVSKTDEPAHPDGDGFPSVHDLQLIEWNAENPDYSVGIATDKLLVLHITTQAGADSLSKVIKAQLQDTPKTTRILRTPRRKGGQQEMYFLFSLPAGALAKARDVMPGVRSLSSIEDTIVGPGSTVENFTIEFANARPLVLAPAWLLELCEVEANNAVGQTTTKENLMSSGAISIETPAAEAHHTAGNVTKLAVAKPPNSNRSKLEWALDAATYLPVHPLHGYVDPGLSATREERIAAAKKAKTPLLPDWPNRASQDPKQIREWWGQWPDANIGGATNGHIVVDIDPRNGGEDSFAGLSAIEHFPDTRTTDTHSGGKHLIYVAPDGPVKGGTNKLGLGLDVKARGGYVVMPGSTIEDRAYTRGNVRPPAFAPRWLVDRCKAVKAKNDAAGKRIVDEDDTAVQLATDWIRDHAPRAELGAIDDTTFEVAARAYDFGCSEATVLELVSEWNEDPLQWARQS
jgi:hypothetical protein